VTAVCNAYSGHHVAERMTKEEGPCSSVLGADEVDLRWGHEGYWSGSGFGGGGAHVSDSDIRVGATGEYNDGEIGAFPLSWHGHGAEGEGLVPRRAARNALGRSLNNAVPV
jgi:hypothetical protein